MDKLEPTTDREIMIEMKGDMKEMSASINRLAQAIERLETNKISAIETRLSKLEKFMNEWGGVLKIISIGALLLSAYAAIKFH